MTVRNELDTNTHPKGVKMTDAEMDAINLERHDVHREWNHTVKPRTVPAR